MNSVRCPNPITCAGSDEKNLFRKEFKMRKRTIFLFLVLACTVSALCLVFTGCVSFNQGNLAGGDRITPTMNNVYGNIGTSFGNYGGTAFGAGFEHAIGDSFSMGAYAGIAGDDYFDLFLKPRYYFFQSAMEKFFVGANLGFSYVTYYDDIFFIAGLHTGYKFVFGSGPSGFSLEPSIGYDFLPGRFNMGVSLGYAWGGEAARPAPAPAPVPAAAPAPARVRDGIYVGIITFGPNAVDITDGPIYLDRAGFDRLNSLLNTRYQKDRVSGTALYYAAQLALANMKKAEPRLPQLQSVTMFTFTDGIEISSRGGSLTEISDPGNRTGTVFRRNEDATVYPRFLRGELNAKINGVTNTSRRQINGRVVEAYIAAVKGEDVTDEIAFNTGLDVLSTSDERRPNSNELRYRSTGSFAQLERMFTSIANDIVNTSTVSTFNMITPEYGPGTKVRMTFGQGITADRVGNAPQYIEGTVTVINGEDWLTDVRYNGVTSSAGTRVRGTSRGSLVTYEFPNFTGFNINRTKAELDPLLGQWMDSGNNAWQRNTEYDFDPNTMRSVRRNNALVYLVLDSSTSIADDNIPLVRGAATNFIRILYNAYNQN